MRDFISLLSEVWSCMMAYDLAHLETCQWKVKSGGNMSKKISSSLEAERGNCLGKYLKHRLKHQRNKCITQKIDAIDMQTPGEEVL